MDAFSWLNQPRMRGWMVLVLFFPLGWQIGCRRGEVRVPTFAASGRLLSADDQPLAHALVVLHPVDATLKAPKPRATTDGEGNFQLTTYETGDGAPQGEFIVTVEQWLRDDPNEAPKNRLPSAFSRPDSSKIRIAITQSANALEPIRLR